MVSPLSPVCAASFQKSPCPCLFPQRALAIIHGAMRNRGGGAFLRIVVGLGAAFDDIFRSPGAIRR